VSFYGKSDGRPTCRASFRYIAVYFVVVRRCVSVLRVGMASGDALTRRRHMQGSGGCLSYTPSGGPKLTQRRYHYNGSRYVTVDLLSVRVRVGFRDPDPNFCC